MKKLPTETVGSRALRDVIGLVGILAFYLLLNFGYYVVVGTSDKYEESKSFYGGHQTGKEANE